MSLKWNFNKINVLKILWMCVVFSSKIILLPLGEGVTKVIGYIGGKIIFPIFKSGQFKRLFFTKIKNKSLWKKNFFRKNYYISKNKKKKNQNFENFLQKTFFFCGHLIYTGKWKFLKFVFEKIFSKIYFFCWILLIMFVHFLHINELCSSPTQFSFVPTMVPENFNFF